MGDEERRPATQDARGSHKYVSSASAQEWQLSSSRLSQSLLPKLGFANKAANPDTEKKPQQIYPRRNIPATAKFGVAFSLFQLNSGSDVWRCLITRRLRASKGGIFATETGT